MVMMTMMMMMMMMMMYSIRCDCTSSFYLWVNAPVPQIMHALVGDMGR